MKNIILTAALVCVTTTAAGAATLFSEDFESYTGFNNGGQFQSGLSVSYGGNLSG